MAGQSATLPLNKAKALAKGAGRELGCSSGGGTKATVPNEGRTLGSSTGASAHKKVTPKHNY